MTVPVCGSGTNVLPHRNAMPQTQDTTPHPGTVYRHGADLSLMWMISPRIKRSCEVSDALTNTGAFSKIGVQPHIMLSDVTKHSYIQSDNRELWYNNSDKFINIKPCQVQLNDLFKSDPLMSYCHISKCGNKRCKTCDILGTSSNFTSSLTNKSYCTRAFDDINCKTCNVVYGITCSHCGLIYVGETKGQLNKRMDVMWKITLEYIANHFNVLGKIAVSK